MNDTERLAALTDFLRGCGEVTFTLDRANGIITAAARHTFIGGLEGPGSTVGEAIDGLCKHLEGHS